MHNLFKVYYAEQFVKTLERFEELTSSEHCFDFAKLKFTDIIDMDFYLRDIISKLEKIEIKEK